MRYCLLTVFQILVKYDQIFLGVGRFNFISEDHQNQIKKIPPPHIATPCECFSGVTHVPDVKTAIIFVVTPPVGEIFSIDSFLDFGEKSPNIFLSWQI